MVGLALRNNLDNDIDFKMVSQDNTDALVERLNAETAKIRWHELQKHYAAGNLLGASAGEDLIKIAIAFHQDNTDLVKNWLASGSLFEVSDQQAHRWFENNAELWAVVIPPFVLVQEVKGK